VATARGAEGRSPLWRQRRSQAGEITTTVDQPEIPQLSALARIIHEPRQVGVVAG
jgi:hypothetical protein